MITPLDDITSILDARRPQPYEWDEMRSPGLTGILRHLSRQRSTGPDDQVETIDIKPRSARVSAACMAAVPASYARIRMASSMP